MWSHDTYCAVHEVLLAQIGSIAGKVLKIRLEMRYGGAGGWGVDEWELLASKPASEALYFTLLWCM